MPTPLRLWHLSSLDAPTVAVVWTLAFAWAAGIRLPAWIPILLALAAWSVYIADRLLDARTALTTNRPDRLRERHRFHWRHRRIFLPLAIGAGCAAVYIIFRLMPSAARAQGSVLALAALAYFTRVHSPHQLPSVGWSGLFPLLKKELLVGVLFTTACALPAVSRATARGGAPPWPLFAAIFFFALLAWLNCHAIEHWESELFQHAGDAWFSGAEEVAEKGLGLRRELEKRPSGAKAHGDLTAFTARLKSCPDTKRSQLQVKAGFSASCERPVFAARFKRELKPPPPSGSSFPAAGVLALIGLPMVFVLFFSEPRSAALVASGAVSALLLALLDRFRSCLTPLALRAAADLVLLTPLALLLK